MIRDKRQPCISRGSAQLYTMPKNFGARLRLNAGTPQSSTTCHRLVLLRKVSKLTPVARDPLSFPAPVLQSCVGPTEIKARTPGRRPGHLVNQLPRPKKVMNDMSIASRPAAMLSSPSTGAGPLASTKPRWSPSHTSTTAWTSSGLGSYAQAETSRAGKAIDALWIERTRIRSLGTPVLHTEEFHSVILHDRNPLRAPFPTWLWKSDGRRQSLNRADPQDHLIW